MNIPKLKINKYILLHLVILLSSVSYLLQKTLAVTVSLSWVSAILFGLIQTISAVHALAWQQILKLVPLNVAIANTAVMFAWGMIWGYLFFEEQVTVYMIVGTLVIFAGIRLVMFDND